jgi:hypothetical protein
MGTAPRRIAVVLDGPATPMWQHSALAGLAESPVLEIVGVRLAGARPRGWARRAHTAIERHLFALGHDALAPVPLARIDADGPAPVQLDCTDADRPTPALLDRTDTDPSRGRAGGAAAELVIWLSELLPPPIDEPRDLIYLRHGGLLEPAEEAFRRAALRGVPCVETEVLMRSGGGRSVLLERTVSGARPFSTTLSRDKALWKIVPLVRRAVERAPGLDRPAPPRGAAGPAPSTVELLARAPLAWSRIVAARLLYDRRWRIRVRERGPEPTRGWAGAGGGAGADDSLVQWKPGHLYADPFLFEYDGAHHLFCEELPPGARRAVISHTQLHPGGTRADPPAPVLSAEYHLSYPFVFVHGGEVFMIPETSAQQRVELHRAVEFPHTWRREGTLIEGLIASDATLLEHEGRLWLFVGVAAPHATMLDELHLFTSISLSGPWQSHPRNPIVSDVRCARPAGAIQRWGGSLLVRPAQDCSRRYGGAISFRAIDELSFEDYAEHEIARLDPGDLGNVVRATHTYACDRCFEAVDLRRRELRVGLPLGRFGRGRRWGLGG